MSDIKAELERKREKLRLLREEKQRRAALTNAGSVAPEQSPTAAIPQTVESVDQILRDLGILNLQPANEVTSNLHAEAATSVSTNKENSVTRKKKQNLVSSLNVIKLDIPPVERVSYCKETQTVGSDQEVTDGLQWDDEEFKPTQEDVARLTYGISPDSDLEGDVDAAAAAAVLRMSTSSIMRSIHTLNESERNEILSSEAFGNFFCRSSKFMERILAEPDTNFFIEYNSKFSSDSHDENVQSASPVSVARTFTDDHMNRNCVISALDWSVHFPELILASYIDEDVSIGTTGGVVLVWNEKFDVKIPEFRFQCQSPVTSACFSPFQPQIIMAGTYSGQIVVWDSRTNRRTPVQRTAPTATAHTHPVFSLCLVGSENAHSLVSVSTDGKLCAWRPDMMLQPPQESMILRHKQFKNIAATSLDFPNGGVNNFVIGSEEYNIYTGMRHGSQSGITGVLDGHQGPVSAISCQRSCIEASDLLLSSSLDWTVKLWSLRDMSLIYSFEDNADYVFDVQWSPVHPALFASGDASGRLALWNLNQDTEAAAFSLNLNSAINKLKWAKSGRILAVGSDKAELFLCNVNDNLAIPRNEDWSEFTNVLKDLKSNLLISSSSYD